MKVDLHNYSTKSFSWTKDHQVKKYTWIDCQITYKPPLVNVKPNEVATVTLVNTIRHLKEIYKKRLIWLICKKYDNIYGEIRYKLA